MFWLRINEDPRRQKEGLIHHLLQWQMSLQVPEKQGNSRERQKNFAGKKLVIDEPSYLCAH